MAYPGIENDLLRQRELLRADDGNQKSLAAWQDAPDVDCRRWHIELYERLLADGVKQRDTLQRDIETKRKCWTEAQRDVRKYYLILWHREQVKLWVSMDPNTVKARHFKTKWVDAAARDVEAHDDA
jgi:hypothetical protein